ncbi:hypothetical protein K469DRAFT_696564 [Zopfia rhizophila CBS 207.26]|uniref:Uncharacterized protein n=1 Tax=Zopfia rhizophila CBS 207.26 TaxID=1314779 RepID=A0A6A6DDH1_9PEZI|nr:hypothetical protein K469DRAFT_696564 [Zopfia rhizophila CBS 207.26]
MSDQEVALTATGFLLASAVYTNSHNDFMLLAEVQTSSEFLSHTITMRDYRDSQQTPFEEHGESTRQEIINVIVQNHEFMKEKSENDHSVAISSAVFPVTSMNE